MCNEIALLCKKKKKINVEDKYVLRFSKKNLFTYENSVECTFISNKKK